MGLLKAASSESVRESVLKLAAAELMSGSKDTRLLAGLLLEQARATDLLAELVQQRRG